MDTPTATQSASDGILQEIEILFPGRIFLTLEEVTTLLNCSSDIIYHWTRRQNPKRRPPRMMVGKTLRFPKREFARWLTEEFKTDRE